MVVLSLFTIVLYVTGPIAFLLVLIYSIVLFSNMLESKIDLRLLDDQLRRLENGKSLALKYVLKCFILLFCLGVVSVYFIHEGAHALVLYLANIPYLWHMNLNFPHIEPLSDIPFTVNVLVRSAGFIAEIIFGYLLLFTNNKYSVKFRRGFIIKDKITLSLFIYYTLAKGWLDIIQLINLSVIGLSTFA